MFTVGLTGGIGSGKSIVSEMFKVLNISVYNSDIQAKLLMENSNEIKKEIIKLLGNESYIENNVNKQYIASKIFTNETLRNDLNSIVHKFVFEDYKQWSLKIKNSKFTILESAIIFETGNAKFNNINIAVISPAELKIDRLKKRGLIDQDIVQRMSSQWTDEKIIELSDFVIYNDEKQIVSIQVIAIFNNIISRINNLMS